MTRKFAHDVVLSEKKKQNMCCIYVLCIWMGVCVFQESALKHHLCLFVL